MLVSFTSSSPQDTMAVAKKLAPIVTPGIVFGLVGDLGAGKTVFTKGFVQAMGGDSDQVRSPTFTLMNIYEASLPIYHFDLYRLESIDDLESIGFSEFARGEGISIIEWPDRISSVAHDVDYWIFIEFGEGDDERLIKVMKSADLEPERLAPNPAAC